MYRPPLAATECVRPTLIHFQQLMCRYQYNNDRHSATSETNKQVYLPECDDDYDNADDDDDDVYGDPVNDIVTRVNVGRTRASLV